MRGSPESRSSVQVVVVRDCVALHTLVGSDEREGWLEMLHSGARIPVLNSSCERVGCG